VASSSRCAAPPEASKGFEPGRWGEPPGRSLAGTAACIVGAGAVGTEIAAGSLPSTDRHGCTPPSARRPARLCRRLHRRPPPRLRRDVDSVIIAAGYQAGSRPSSTTAYSERCAPRLARQHRRGGLLDSKAALAHLNTGTRRPRDRRVPDRALPADGPLLAHPHVVRPPHRLPHQRLLRGCSRRLGDALAAYLNCQPPPVPQDHI